MVSTKRFTSSLPITVLDELNRTAVALDIPMNQILEKALRLYLTELNRKDFEASFRRAANDVDQVKLAESGTDDFKTLIDSI